MSYITERVSKYVKGKRINLSKMAGDTGIEYAAIYDSLASKTRNRDLRDDELIKICQFLDKNPMDFAEDPTGRG